MLGYRRMAKPRKDRVAKILAGLDALYPHVTCELDHKTPWQLLVATILSAQCTDKRVNMVTPHLFERFPALEDLAHAGQDEVAAIIKSTGFFNNKARSIIGAARKIVSDFQGEVPRTMEELLTVPGAARKTANVVLGTCFNIASGVVVDTHVVRISHRLGLTVETDPVKIEKDLMGLVPRPRWVLFSHQVIHHGRQLCVARNPKCSQCLLEPVCHAPDKTV